MIFGLLSKINLKGAIALIVVCNLGCGWRNSKTTERDQAKGRIELVSALMGSSSVEKLCEIMLLAMNTID